MRKAQLEKVQYEKSARKNMKKVQYEKSEHEKIATCAT